MLNAKTLREPHVEVTYSGFVEPYKMTRAGEEALVKSSLQFEPMAISTSLLCHSPNWLSL